MRLVVAWLVFATIGYVWGDAIVLRYLPLVERTIRIITPAYSAKVSLVPRAHGTQLLLDAHVLVPIPLGPGREIPFGESVPASADIAHVLVPLVLFFNALLAYPARQWRERMLSIVIGLPVSALLLALTAPFQLVGLIELAIQQASEADNVARAVPFVLKWMVFLEGGGRWVLPIAAAVLCMSGARCRLAQRN
ncbi:MAG: hypothetical protein HYX63_05485 [Gammaproteobacteria bacterium]|nr:hypothetical protein [Gammaproteobacteria bacterium]